MDLRSRLIKYHEEQGIKYKDIAIECEIGFSTMYNYTSGLRELKAPIAARLEQYLADKGY